MANDDFVIRKGILMKCKGSGGDIIIPDGVNTIDLGSI